MTDTDTEYDFKDFDLPDGFTKGGRYYPISRETWDAMPADVVATMRVQRPAPRAE